jgi:hypothetical protein
VTNPPYGNDPYALPAGPDQPYGQQPVPYQQPPQQPGPYPPPYGAPASGPPVSGMPGSPVPYSPYAAYSPPPVSGYAAGYPPNHGLVQLTAYGQDPVTGEPYSDKSKIVAGLLQLLLGALLSLGGVGRLYAGNTAIGVTQICLSLLGWIAFWCGFVLFFVSWFVWFGLWVWFVVDGIVMLAGRPRDGQGRLLHS